jgi:2-polyprenyl-3-methyl-5-hydroxy-6-metoxy-1,4-benzoquinol methylase
VAGQGRTEDVVEKEMNTRQRWIRLAPEYLEAILRKEKGDYLRNKLLTPHLMRILGPLDGLRVLDVGCGEGYLARRMARKGARVWAFDWMDILISHAREEEQRSRLGIKYAVADASRRFPCPSAIHLVVANMVLKDMPRIQTTVSEAHRVLRRGGRFVLTVLHPCFCMSSSQWQARKSIRKKHPKVSFELEAPYTTRKEFLKTVSGSRTQIVHFHRPLSTYVSLLRRNGFLVSGLWEPVLGPNTSCPAKYEYAAFLPPFLLMEGTKP